MSKSTLFIGVPMNDVNDSEAQQQNEFARVPLDHSTAEDVFNDNLHFNPDELMKECQEVSWNEFDCAQFLKDMEMWENDFSPVSVSVSVSQDHSPAESVVDEFSSRVSINHSTTKNAGDIALDAHATHTEVNKNDTPGLAPRKKRKKINHWTNKEQRLFLIGLEKYSWGYWKNISNLIGTKTNTQVASHAQKYEHRKKKPPEEKKRRSIHDMTLQDIGAIVPHNINQQNWVSNPNFVTQQLHQLYHLQNRIPTQNFAIMQPQGVQQLQQNTIPTPYFPIQPHAMQTQDMSQFNFATMQRQGVQQIQQNRIPTPYFPIQPHAVQTQDMSQFNLSNYMAYPTGGQEYDNALLSGSSWNAFQFGNGHF